ncbi:MAG: S41 family peptidase [Pseudomonadales bacterium]
MGIGNAIIRDSSNAAVVRSRMRFRQSTFFGITLPLTVLLTAGWGPELAAAENDTGTDPEAAEERLPLEQLRAFTEVLDRIRSSYVEPVSDATLLENAIRGMLDGLDPHSAYLDEEAFRDLQEATSGEFGGVGIEVAIEDGLVRVISPIDDTPAERAGIRSGDVIVSLNDKPVTGMGLIDAVDSMRGEPGTDIKITVRRAGVEEPIDFDLVRDVIGVTSVRSRMLETGFGYLRISQFQTGTGKDVAKAVTALEAEAGGELKGLIMDLRNNPGGVLRSSVEVADTFLKKGVIVYTEGRLPNSELRFNATGHDMIEGAPIVVLVNGGTASASEIVAGALQDHNRAVIMGTESFGKGSVQTVLPLTNERAIKLTTALYYTPNGRSIQLTGITPDISVERATIRREAPADRVRESDLPGHLGNATRADARSDRFWSDDLQLLEALNLLKGIHVLGLREE